VQLHPLTVLLALVFWGVLWGPLGVLLATPITSVLVVLLGHLPITRPIANLFAGRDKGQVPMS
jgi:AI-2 transport protein TqsA